MPVLSLLMAGHPRARAIAELAPAVSRLTLLYALPAMIGRDWSGCCVIVLARPRTSRLGG